jgi:3-oxoadipate enol-lactonase
VSRIATTRLVADVAGDGPPVIFVHGLGGTSNSFEALLPALRGFRTIRPDLPGSGRSRLPHEPLSIALMTDAVVDMAKSLGAFPAHLVGHSMGTIVCQQIAAAMPEAVLSLTLFGPILEPGEAARQRIRERAGTARQQGMDVVADAVCAAGLSSSSKASNPLTTAFVRESHMRQDSEGFAATCEALASATAADLRLIRCPVLLVTGDEDQVAPPTAAQAMADRIRNARLKVLDRCGHWTPIEKPAECAGLLAAFVREMGN